MPWIVFFGILKKTHLKEDNVDPSSTCDTADEVAMAFVGHKHIIYCTYKFYFFMIYLDKARFMKWIVASLHVVQVINVRRPEENVRHKIKRIVLN